MKYFNQVKQEYIELLPVRMLPKNPYINSVHKDDRERKVKTFLKRLLNFEAKDLLDYEDQGVIYDVMKKPDLLKLIRD